MEWIGNTIIKLDKQINDLDTFVLDFIKIIHRYTPYVIISGYVAILLGRSRATEDVDMFIKKISKETFLNLYKDLKDNGFWCLNAETPEEIYAYLEEKIAVRFAHTGKVIPNMEIKFPKSLLDNDAFNNTLSVQTKEGTIIISALEPQIAYKRYYLKSQKDLEDAYHLETVFKDKINLEKIYKYKRIIEDQHGTS